MERSGSLFDPQFPTYVRSMIVCGVLLCVLWLVGAKFEFAKKMGWIKFRIKGMTKVQFCFSVGNKISVQIWEKSWFL